MNEPIFLPDIETRSDAGSVETVRMRDRCFVFVMLHDRRVENSVTMIDEMHTIFLTGFADVSSTCSGGRIVSLSPGARFGFSARSNSIAASSRNTARSIMRLHQFHHTTARS